MARNSLATHQITNPEPTVKRSGLSRKTPMARSGFMRKRKPFEPKNGPSVQTLDDLCREVVFLRDGYACQKCGWRCELVTLSPKGKIQAGKLQWCHIFSRQYHSVRWDPDNSLALCSGCHLWQHHNPTLSTEWFEAKWPLRLNDITIRRNGGWKPDRGLVLLSLQQQLRAMGK